MLNAERARVFWGTQVFTPANKSRRADSNSMHIQPFGMCRAETCPPSFLIFIVLCSCYGPQPTSLSRCTGHVSEHSPPNSVDLFTLIHAVGALFLFSTIFHSSEGEVTCSRVMGKPAPLTGANQSWTAIRLAARLRVNAILTAWSETLHGWVYTLCNLPTNPYVRLRQWRSQRAWEED